MDSFELQQQLNKLWAGTIEELDFNIHNHTISFKIKSKWGDTIEKFNVIFSDVSSFYFVQAIGKRRLVLSKPELGDYKELTSINFYKDGVGKITVESSASWAQQWYSSANFVIEIWDSILFIEAKAVIVNNKIFGAGSKFLGDAP